MQTLKKARRPFRVRAHALNTPRVANSGPGNCQLSASRLFPKINVNDCFFEDLFCKCLPPLLKCLRVSCALTCSSGTCISFSVSMGVALPYVSGFVDKKGLGLWKTLLQRD